MARHFCIAVTLLANVSALLRLALSVLWKRGVRVRDDISMAGFDDIADGRYAVPSLTTVSFDKRAIASEAVHLLTERMGDRSHDSRMVSVGYSIM